MSNPGTQDLTLPSKRSMLVEVFPTEGAFDLGPEDCIGGRRVQRDGEAHQVESPVSAVGRPDRAGDCQAHSCSRLLPGQPFTGSIKNFCEQTLSYCVVGRGAGPKSGWESTGP